MWKRPKEETKDSVDSTMSGNPNKEETSAGSSLPEGLEEIGGETANPAAAHIGQSLRIKGELRGSENMHIDGQVEGSIELRDHQLTVGPAGEVQANVNANWRRENLDT